MPSANVILYSSGHSGLTVVLDEGSGVQRQLLQQLEYSHKSCMEIWPVYFNISREKLTFWPECARCKWKKHMVCLKWGGLNLCGTWMSNFIKFAEHSKVHSDLSFWQWYIWRTIGNLRLMVIGWKVRGAWKWLEWSSGDHEYPRQISQQFYLH